MQTSDFAETAEQRAARMARETQAARTAAPAPPPALPALRDPLPYCIYSTVALIAWLVSPPLALAFFALLGLRAYGKAWRAGLRRSNCLLRDPRLVLAYLSLLFIAGSVITVWNLLRLFS